MKKEVYWEYQKPLSYQNDRKRGFIKERENIEREMIDNSCDFKMGKLNPKTSKRAIGEKVKNNRKIQLAL